VQQNNEQDRRIVVGVDGSEPAKAAMRWALTQARLTDATVEAVTAWQDPAMSGFSYGWSPMLYDGDSIATLTEKTLNETDRGSDRWPGQRSARRNQDPSGPGPSGPGDGQSLGRGSAARARKPGPQHVRRDSPRFGQPTLCATRALSRGRDSTLTAPWWPPWPRAGPVRRSSPSEWFAAMHALLMRLRTETWSIVHEATSNLRYMQSPRRVVRG
jgi:hypothetical protein